MFAIKFFLLFVIINAEMAFACSGLNTKLDDIINDPELKALLSRPIRPREPEVEIEIEDPKVVRTRKIEELESELAVLQSGNKATPAEIAQTQRQIDTLKAEEDFERILSGTFSPRSRVPDDIVEEIPVEVAPEVPPTKYEPIAITDADRKAFDELLRRPMRTNRYDIALSEYQGASSVRPVASKYRDPLTGENINVDVIDFIKSDERGDLVKIRFRTPDGRTVTKEVRMTSLTHESSRGDIALNDESILTTSERFTSNNEGAMVGRTVDSMIVDALIGAERTEYLEIQRKLDTANFGSDEMLKLVSRQGDIVIKYSPLRNFEIQMIEDNLAGLNNSTSLQLTPGEKRAIEDIRKIIASRDGNPRVIEDRDIFTRAENISEETVLAARYKNRGMQVRREIRALTGDGLKVPFEKRSAWSTSRIKTDIGGLKGSTSMKESLDHIDAFLKHEQFLTEENFRGVTTAIRDVRSRLRRDSINAPDTEDFLKFLELKLEDHRLSRGP